jgi:hypothetical protein
VARQLGRRPDQIIARSYTSSEDETDSDADRPDQPEARHRRKHLYVALDDWKKGFSIHKLDLDDDSDGGDLTQRPPVHRQTTWAWGRRAWSFAAVGSKIVAAGRISSSKDDNITLVYDTEAAGLSIVPRLPAALHLGWDLATAAGNRLYTLEGMSCVDGKYNGAMHLLEDAPPPAPADDKYGIETFWWGTRDHWSWSSIQKPLPFRANDIESFAVHSEGGGRTLFVSVGDWDNRLVRTSETFSYDTTTKEWTRHGDWDLPFEGQAHYDAELEAWVGLRKVYEPLGPHNPQKHWTDGYLCSCDVPPSDGSPVQPDWKLCAEGLIPPYRDPADADVRLLYMGGSNYCLVEVMACERFKSKHLANVGRKCVIRVATFRLKYGKKGELLVAARRPDRSYHFSTFVGGTPKADAFWM